MTSWSTVRSSALQVFCSDATLMLTSNNIQVSFYLDLLLGSKFLESWRLGREGKFFESSINNWLEGEYVTTRRLDVSYLFVTGQHWRQEWGLHSKCLPPDPRARMQTTTSPGQLLAFYYPAVNRLKWSTLIAIVGHILFFQLEDI